MYKYIISKYYSKVFLFVIIIFLFSVDTTNAAAITWNEGGEGGLRIYSIPFVFFIFVIMILFFLKGPIQETILERRIDKSEKSRIIRENQEREKQIREQELQQKKEEEINQYRQLRKDIEAMQQYQQWRQAVLEKFGRKCAVCGSTENIEVDHRYKSFYAIVKEYGITNTVQAYECAILWNVDNGAPLCKSHHDQTKSSIYYKENNSI